MVRVRSFRRGSWMQSLFLVAVWTILIVLAAAVSAEEDPWKDVVWVDASLYEKPTEEELRERLTAQEYEVTQNNATEPPFYNEYYLHKDAGIYVDPATGEPLFSSRDKYDSGSGWPAFTRPLDPEVLTYVTDTTHGMVRTEVRSRVGDSHLGHVFPDGPAEAGGQRYCINSASLRFVSVEQMEEQGYGYLMAAVEATEE